MYLVLGSWQSGSAVQSVGSMAVDVDESKIDESDYAMPKIPSLQLCGDCWAHRNGSALPFSMA